MPSNGLLSSTVIATKRSAGTDTPRPDMSADLKENKMALHIAGQLSVAEANIRAIASGRTPPKTYKAKTGNLMMAVTLGSRAGVIFAPPVGALRSTWLNRKVKATFGWQDVPPTTRSSASPPSLLSTSRTVSASARRD